MYDKKKIIAALMLPAIFILIATQFKLSIPDQESWVSDEDAQIGSCINLGAALEAVEGENWGYTITQPDLVKIANQNFDTVRLPVRWSDYTGNGPDYTIEPEFFDVVDIVVKDALDADLKVILNVHHFNEFNSDPDNNTDKLKAIWQQLSKHYKGYSEDLIFELLNEPHFDDVGGVDQEQSDSGLNRMNHINSELLNIVRPQHPHRWIIIGSSDWGSMHPFTRSKFSGKFLVPNDPKIIVSFHYYDPLAFTHQDLSYEDTYPTFREWGTDADLAIVKEDMLKMSAFRSSTWRDLNIFLGEFGSSREGAPADGRARYSKAVIEAARENNFSWCYWDFGSPTFGIYDVETQLWDDGIISILKP